LTNPDVSGKIGNNREGELAIGNYRELSGIIGNYRELSGIIGNNRELSGIIGTRFLPIFPIILNQEKPGVIGSVESQFLESQLLFHKFSAKCQIPDFLQSVPGG
jgi:hypothetical protein